MVRDQPWIAGEARSNLTTLRESRPGQLIPNSMWEWPLKVFKSITMRLAWPSRTTSSVTTVSGGTTSLATSGPLLSARIHPSWLNSSRILTELTWPMSSRKLRRTGVWMPTLSSLKRSSQSCQTCPPHLHLWSEGHPLGDHQPTFSDSEEGQNQGLPVGQVASSGPLESQGTVSHSYFKLVRWTKQ